MIGQQLYDEFREISMAKTPPWSRLTGLQKMDWSAFASKLSDQIDEAAEDARDEAWSDARDSAQTYHGGEGNHPLARHRDSMG